MVCKGFGQGVTLFLKSNVNEKIIVMLRAMKLSIILVNFFAIVLLLFVQVTSFAETKNYHNGIFYDPIHSLSYIKAAQLDDVDTMRSLIDEDLSFIHNILHFDTIRTSYPNYCTRLEKKCIDIIQESKKYQLNVLLGIHEFTTNDNCETDKICEQWTANEINAAIYSIKRAKNVIGLVVGEFSDDIQVDRTLFNDLVILQIEKIRKSIPNSIPIGTIENLPLLQKNIEVYNKNDLSNILNHVDFVGLDYYPFWQEKILSEAKKDFKKTIAKINKQLGKILHISLVITGEGWSSYGSKNASINSLLDYYKWRNKRIKSEALDSYYFSAFDTLPNQLPNDYSAPKNYFGLATIGRQLKSDQMKTEKPLLVFFDNTNKTIKEYIQQYFIRACDVNDKCWSIYGNDKDSLIDPAAKVYRYLDAAVIDHIYVVINESPIFPIICSIPHSLMQKLKPNDLIKISGISSMNVKVQPCLVESQESNNIKSIIMRFWKSI